MYYLLAYLWGLLLQMSHLQHLQESLLGCNNVIRGGLPLGVGQQGLLQRPILPVFGADWQAHPPVVVLQAPIQPVEPVTCPFT